MTVDKKSANYVAVYAERGLIGTMGSVCEGLLLSKKVTGLSENSMRYRIHSNPPDNFA
jgi:hypothetical protein